MAQPAPPRHCYTYAEYLAYEQDSGLKHEYEARETLAVAGNWEYSDITSGAVQLQTGATLELATPYTGLPE